VQQVYTRRICRCGFQVFRVSKCFAYRQSFLHPFEADHPKYLIIKGIKEEIEEIRIAPALKRQNLTDKAQGAIQVLLDSTEYIGNYLL
jgi:hypothetical protein